MTESDEFELTDQQSAALDLDRNISITAGAGTGKTTTLEERYRHILKQEPTVDPTNVVTITFTRDAAAELRDGIREVIDEELSEADPGEYERWRHTKDEVENAYVHTIHGFCSRILQEFAVEANVDPHADTLDETDAEVMVTGIAREILIAALDEGGTGETVPLSAAVLQDIEADIRRLARLYDRDALVGLMRGLIAERPESDRWAAAMLETDEDTYVQDAFARAAPVPADEADELAERQAVCDAIETIEDLATRRFAFTADEDDGRATLDRIAGLLPEEGFDGCSTRARQEVLLAACDEVTSNDGDPYSQTYRYAGSAGRWSEYGLGDAQADLQHACETLIDALEPGSRNLDVDLDAIAPSAPYVFAIARLYHAVREVYDQRKRERNALDYTDLIDRTVTFLETNEAARRQLRAQFAYLMVDEVQDTDPRQWELVRLLTGSDAPTFDGQNVFLVGDEKQSIYRFRRADVTMVSDAREQLAAANPEGVDAEEELTGNFRTLSEPLDFLNDLFDCVFEPEDPVEGFAPYEARPQDLDSKRTKGTEITGTVEYLVTPGRAEDIPELGMEDTWFGERAFTSKADREAQAVAARLTRLFDDGLTVYDPDTDAYRPAGPRDVALLFRSGSRLEAFERALEEHEIPYTSAGGQSLFETPEIRPLVNLLRVLHQPQRDVPLYGVLRSPLFGFADKELAKLYHPEQSLWERLQNVDGRLGDAGNRLQAWREVCGLEEATRSTAWGEFVSRVIDETGYLVGVGADERPTNAVVNVNQFRETLRGWEEGSALPLSDVLTRIDREQEFGEDLGEGEVPTDLEGVQLRTVHSTKGLEFPIVVVPELGRETNSGPTISHDFGGGRSRGLAYLETVEGDPVLGVRGPDPSNPVTTTKTPDWQLAEAVQSAEERAEAKRVLYVAATRARDHLVLSSTHRFDDEESAFGAYDTGEDVSCWRDWVQPVLLEGRDLLPRLQRGDVATAELPNSTYRVRRPPAPVAGPGDMDEAELEFALDIPSPEVTGERTALAATTLRDLYNGMGDGSMDTAGGEQDPFFADLGQRELSASEFGDLVHGLCELQLSGVEIDWDEHPYRLVVDPDLLTADDIRRAKEHVAAGVDAVASLERELDVTSTADEIRVRWELEHGEVVGDIDHLTVTEDRYYVTDYKTDSLAGQDVDDLAEHYWAQLMVYACALQHAAPKEGVVLRLIFTEAGVRREKTPGQDELIVYEDEVDGMLEEPRVEI